MAAATPPAALLGALRDRPLPCGLVDLDALEHNVDVLVAPVAAAGRTVRLASKSVRCVDLLRRVEARGGDAVRGVMAYAVTEAAFLVDHHFHDVLVAYPTASPSDAATLAALNLRPGVVASVVVDCADHLAVLARAAREAGSEVPVVVEVDTSWGPLGGRVRVGALRSPLRTAGSVVALASQVANTTGLRFHGVMGYEAHVAGLQDANPFAPALNPFKRWLKRQAVPAVARLRAEVAERLHGAGLVPTVFNGGGTGSVDTTPLEPCVTEVTVGSGFVDSHLFDYYAHRDRLPLRPAVAFALQVVRVPEPGVVTCHGGGWVASGEPGWDRLPLPWWPAGLRYVGVEGAGEVQTPLRLPPGVVLSPGDPVLFRHAKAGELAEHLRSYLLVRGGEVVGEVPTYRGEGGCFLG